MSGFYKFYDYDIDIKNLHFLYNFPLEKFKPFIRFLYSHLKSYYVTLFLRKTKIAIKPGRL